ncbi:probable serine/threonine-protein kinase WNK11 isoform X1 [Diospyros lotus]|uniref:probable serine/threonine-protein kinase WNK11 isoform X1 n=2 Tax=Diospyros lotus TaxID=55363 RepID=UPI00224EC28E|nr:probable serine/threonine-protein kinase WNK11 isoform X1 [Diospyros lotus]
MDADYVSLHKSFFNTQETFTTFLELASLRANSFLQVSSGDQSRTSWLGILQLRCSWRYLFVAISSPFSLLFYVACKRHCFEMPAEGPDSSDQDKEPFVEVDPTGRFGRYSDLLGAGAVKKVYRAFDQREGRDVAWNQVRLRNFSDDPTVIKRLLAEISLLKSLKNDYIIVLYSFWKDNEHNTLNFITEACTSGNLRDYRKKHRHVSMKALKKWSIQILRGLNYLHTHDPCIIHRDLNCSNIFINGNIGKVKIGDLGLAAIVGKSHHAHSLLGTPEYMAPELYEEDYTELVDIYSYGMCLLEMATLEIPYSECDSIVKIYKKVTAGVKPQAMNKVSDPELKAFIHKCIGQPRARPSAADLLKDPFLSDVDCEEEDLKEG